MSLRGNCSARLTIRVNKCLVCWDFSAQLKDHVIKHVPISDVAKESYVKLALSARQSVPERQRSEQEILEEYEQQLIEKYSDDGVDVEPDVPKTIH